MSSSEVRSLRWPCSPRTRRSNAWSAVAAVSTTTRRPLNGSYTDACEAGCFDGYVLADDTLLCVDIVVCRSQATAGCEQRWVVELLDLEAASPARPGRAVTFVLTMATLLSIAQDCPSPGRRTGSTVSQTSDQLLRVDRDATGVLRLTMDRPAAMNALCPGLVLQLMAAFELVAADQEVRAVVLAGAGRAFCAGGDLDSLRETANASLEAVEIDAGRYASLYATVAACPVPLIVRAHGASWGGGTGLAACAGCRSGLYRRCVRLHRGSSRAHPRGGCAIRSGSRRRGSAPVPSYWGEDLR